MTATLTHPDEVRISDLIGGTKLIPGWTIETEWDQRRSEDWAAFRLATDRPDAVDPTQRDIQVFRLHCPLAWTDDKIKRWLRGGQRLIALHEVDELFKVHGDYVVHPHPGGELAEGNEYAEVIIGQMAGRGWFKDPDDDPFSTA